jgi:GNAT superfamily N-acetyltransferase
VIKEWIRGHYRVSSDPERLQLDVIHGYLSRRSYWAAGIPRDVVQRALRGSLCFGLYDDDRQIGFSRVVTDRATFAYLADVFVLEEYRHRGLGNWMIGCVLAHPDLQGLRRFHLGTRDAHALYARHGFVPLKNPSRFMEIYRPDAYSKVS